MAVETYYPKGGTLGEKLRRAAAAAMIANSVAATPLMAPAAHGGDTFDYSGQTGLVIDNGGKMYQLVIAGVAGTGTKPAGTDEKLLYADGACYWRYMGKTSPSADDALVPAVTNANAAPAGLTNYLGMGSDTGLQYARNDWANYVLNRTSYTDAAYGVNETLGLGKTGNVTIGDSAYPGLSSNGNRWTIVTDAPVVGFTWHNGLKMGRVIVDGVPLWHGTRVMGAGAAGTASIKLDWSASAQRKVRTIQVELPQNSDLQRIYYSDYSQLFKRNRAAEIKAAVLGDSYVSGGDGLPLEPGRNWATIAGDLLGWTVVQHSGVGGTGISNPGANWKFRDRILPDLFGIGRTTTSTAAAYTELGSGFQQPDVVVVQGSVNDVGQANLDKDALALYDDIRHYFDGPIVFTGIVQNGNLAAGQAATAEALLFSLLPSDDPLLFKLPVSTTDSMNPAAWFAGTGHSQIGTEHVASIIGALTDTNPAMIAADGVHPSPHGIKYLAYRFAEAFRQRVLPNVR